MKKLISLMMVLSLILCLAACGSEETSASASESAAEVSAEESAEASESSAEEAASSEDSVLDEVYEPTVDELFSDLIDDSQGLFLKLQCYNRKGMPIKNATLTISGGADELTFQTDSEGYALIDALEPDITYTVSLAETPDEDSEDSAAEEPAPYGSFKLTIQSGEEYAGADEEDGSGIILEVPDGTDSCADLAVTATDDDGSIASFTLSRMDMWKGVPED